MDGLIEQMLDGLFRMAEKATGPSKIIKLKSYKIKKPSGTDEGKTSNYVRSAGVQECRSADKCVQLTADGSDPQAIPEQARLPVAFPNLGGSAKEVPVRKRRRQRVKMVEGMLFE